MHDADQPRSGLVSKRTMEVVVALAFLAVAGVVIGDSLRLASAGNRMVRSPDTFRSTSRSPCRRQAWSISIAPSSAALAPKSPLSAPRPVQDHPGAGALADLCGAIGYIGIYAASAIYIALFMWYFGSYAIWKGSLVGATIAVALFLMFERWFLVPLPKGPLEAWLGY
jgi:hypothetical protein